MTDHALMRDRALLLGVDSIPKTVERDRRLRDILDARTCITCGGDVSLWEPYRYPTGCYMCEQCAALPIAQLRVLLLDHLLADDSLGKFYVQVCCSRIQSPDFRVVLSEASEWEPWGDDDEGLLFDDL